MSDILNKKWSLGYKDRGHGHGDFAVLTVEDDLIVECPNREVAQHIINLHNRELTAEVSE